MHTILRDCLKKESETQWIHIIINLKLEHLEKDYCS